MSDEELVRELHSEHAGPLLRYALRPGTECTFWVINAAGDRVDSGSWQIGPGYGQHWYSASAPTPVSGVHGFQITSQGKTLINIPAS